MTHKYKSFDKKLFAAMNSQQKEITTQSLATALDVLKSKTHQRHITRRLSQLEQRGVISCRTHGMTRICEVTGELPEFFAKRQVWRNSIHSEVQQDMRNAEAKAAEIKPIKASTSEEFLAAGGVINVLPTQWDNPTNGSMPLGDSFYFDE